MMTEIHGKVVLSMSGHLLQLLSMPFQNFHILMLKDSFLLIKHVHVFANCLKSAFKNDISL